MPGAQVLQRPALRAAHQVVHRPLALVGPGAHHDGAGEVGAVAVHLGAEVEQQPLAPADRARAGARVGQRRARARGDDRRERVPLASPPAERAPRAPAPISSSVWPTRDRRAAPRRAPPAPARRRRGSPPLPRATSPSGAAPPGPSSAPPGSGSARRPARRPSPSPTCASMPIAPWRQSRRAPGPAGPRRSSGPPRPSPRRPPRPAPAPRSGNRSPAPSRSACTRSSAGRAGEAGQVADVGQVGDQERRPAPRPASAARSARLPLGAAVSRHGGGPPAPGAPAGSSGRRIR